MHSFIFEEVSLSLLSISPHANVTVYNLKIINHKPFEGDTLAMIKLISFDMSIKEFFKSTKEEPIVVSSIAIDGALINITSYESGNANYYISKKTKDSTIEKDTTNSSLIPNTLILKELLSTPQFSVIPVLTYNSSNVIS